MVVLFHGMEQISDIAHLYVLTQKIESMHLEFHTMVIYP